jgi:hypothetical protein
MAPRILKAGTENEVSQEENAVVVIACLFLL